MRAIQLVAPRTLEERVVADPPDPGPGEVLVRLRAVGICGSDMHWYLEGGIGSHKAVYPQTLGHEPAGEVLAIGSGVRNVKPGDRVVVEPSITCGYCENCLRGRHNNCVRSVFMGSPQAPGFFREYAVVPAHNTDAVPESFTWEQATLVEPLAVMVHILELVDIHIGDTVAVLGAGPIGMFCGSMARLAGASRVFVADRVDHRLALAAKMGADVTVNTSRESFRAAVMDSTGGRGADVVFDAAGAAETINTAIDVAALSGRVVLIGIPAEPLVGVDVNLAMAKELVIQTIKRSNHKTREAIALMASGRISDALVTHRLPLAETGRAFAMLAAYEDGVGKAIIEVA